MDIECANCGEPMYRDRYSRRVRRNDLADRDAYYKWLCTNLCAPVLVADNPDVPILDIEDEDDDWDDDDDEDVCPCCY